MKSGKNFSLTSPYNIWIPPPPPPPLYLTPLKITYEKWKHVQEIEETINKDCHW